jgi:hypothetical protein
MVKVAGYCAGVADRAGLNQTVYLSKSITLRGGYTATNWITPDRTAHPTVLDAQGRGRVIAIVGSPPHSGEELNVTLAGLEITGGDAGRRGGGGLYILRARATVSSSRVAHNAALEGGGLYLSESYLDLHRSIVTTNTALKDGGGVSLRRSSAFIARSTIEENRAARWGGGLYLYDSDHVSVTESAVISNASAQDGGGIHLNMSNAVLEDVLVKNNTADDDGGGVFVYRPQAVAVRKSEFVGNRAGDRGGGVHLLEADLDLVNDIVAANLADAGSGLYLDNASSSLVHTTIARNVGQSGVSLVGHSVAALTNTILVSHSVGIDIAEGCTATLASTLWGSGHWANAKDWEAEGALLTDSRHYWEDPRFRAPHTGDYRIGPGSAAADKGLSTSISTDIDGDPRPIGPAPDLGADEIWEAYLPLVLHTIGTAESQGQQ